MTDLLLCNVWIVDRSFNPADLPMIPVQNSPSLQSFWADKICDSLSCLQSIVVGD